jgi:hypothetical protein
MTSRPELVLYSSLTDVERMEYFAREGVASEIIPTATMRPVVEWAIKYYFDSGCTQAPSREALMLEWGHIFEHEDITLDDPDDEIETPQWVLEYLRSTYVHLIWQEWSKKAASEIAGAPTDQRVNTLSRHTVELAIILQSVRSRAQEAQGASAFEDALRRYAERVTFDGAPQGMMFGLEHVDNHTHGIHPGELAVLAAGPKTGKSFFLANVVLFEWLRGRRALLFTLENSVEMTIDRIVCAHAGIDSRQWQRGECTEAQIRRVGESAERLAGMVGDLIVVMPPRGHRTVEAMVREAHIREADSLAIDQLTFIESAPAKGARPPRHEAVRDIMHELKVAISGGPRKLPCLLAHQVNREGMKAADKTGHLEMWMLAESSEVERTADWAFGMYRSIDDRMTQSATLQTLAARREDVASWRMAYDPSIGLMRTIREITMGGTE